MQGVGRRIVSIWFPRFASDRVLRLHAVSGPFVLTQKANNANRIYCLNDAAIAEGLHHGMPYADARAFYPDLESRVAEPELDSRFLQLLCRWAKRFCPWVGLEGRDGLVLDVTGATHLWGGEEALLLEMRSRLERLGLFAKIGLADTRGAAWALAHYNEGISPIGEARISLDHLPVSALRIDDQMAMSLQRLGLRRIGDLARTARAPLNRRFGPSLLQRLDQAFGLEPEEVSPHEDPPHYAVRLTLPEPIGVVADVMAGTERLLLHLCNKLDAQEAGARQLSLTLRRVDQAQQQVELRLAQALRDPQRILSLFERGLSEIDAGFGIDQLRLEAIQVEKLPAQQLSHVSARSQDRLDDLISRLGTRIGLENVQRFLPADSHIPERSFIKAPIASSRPGSGWSTTQLRPICIFPPEPVGGVGLRPPARFRWRGMTLNASQVTGPERIAPEWWLQEECWKSGLRDYWCVKCKQGHQLWMFYAPQKTGWFVHGKFA